jgi:hypothetical protein
VDAGPSIAALFAEVAGIGPFFVVATGPAPGGGGWVPVDALWSSGSCSPLPARVAAVRSALGTDARVAASTAFQGLAAQLVAPLFAGAVVGGALPSHHPRAVAAALHWRPGPDGPWLWWAGADQASASRGDPGGLLAGLLEPLVAAVRAHVAVSPRVLWSDAASAVAAARRLVVAARPEAGSRATAVAQQLLTTPPLAPVSALRAPEPPDERWTFRRRSCCLYYRVPGGGICGDCVLVDRCPRGAGRRASRAAPCRPQLPR